MRIVFLLSMQKDIFGVVPRAIFHKAAAQPIMRHAARVGGEAVHRGDGVGDPTPLRARHPFELRRHDIARLVYADKMILAAADALALVRRAIRQCGELDQRPRRKPHLPRPPIDLHAGIYAMQRLVHPARVRQLLVGLRQQQRPVVACVDMPSGAKSERHRLARAGGAAVEEVSGCDFGHAPLHRRGCERAFERAYGAACGAGVDARPQIS